MSTLIFTDPHYAWQFNIRDIIYPDTVYSNCLDHLARRLRQAFFMEVFL